MYLRGDREQPRLAAVFHSRHRIGIALDQQEATFQEFQQAQNSGNRLYGGTGLGLAVSKSIVTLMGGAIGLKSMPGEGTTLTFNAPFECRLEHSRPAHPE